MSLVIAMALIIVLVALARAVRLRFGFATTRTKLILIGLVVTLVAAGLYRFDSPLMWLVIPVLSALGVFDRENWPERPWWALWKWHSA